VGHHQLNGPEPQHESGALTAAVRDVASPATPDDRAIARILVGAAAVEVSLFLWFVAIGRAAFIEFVWTPDTSSYIRVAQQLAERHTLAEGPRTLGYPVFAAAAYVIGGGLYAPYILIALQLLLNLGFTWLGWRLLQRIAPEAGLRLRSAATVLLFWAGMGMAAFLMTDFLAAFCFSVFLYGLLFWRDRWGALVSAGALAVATLTRPTFTFLPLLLPAAAYLVRRITSKIPATHLLLFAACSIAATSVSVAYQYAFNRYAGPSPLLILPIQEMLYHGVVRQRSPAPDYATFQQQFAAEVEKRAGRPFATLTAGERERTAKEIFGEAFRAYPVEITANVLKNALKYVFVPVESSLSRFWAIYASASTYATAVRPIVALVWFPVWTLALVPPIESTPRRRMYYLLMMGCLAYIIGFSSISTGSGERIRFPVLMFMFPVLMWNVEWLRSRRWSTRWRVSAVLGASK